MNWKLTIPTLSLLLVAGHSLVAQEVTATILGTVKDKAGKPIQGAIIKLRAPQAIGEKTVVSDAQGNFRVPLLLPGDYTATTSKDGYVGTRSDFRLSGGSVIRQDIVLREIQTAVATVEVVAVSAIVDKTQTKTSVSLDQRDIDVIPVANSFVSRALAGLALSPAVTGNQLYQSIRGGAQGQTQYMVNGLSVRDNITMQGRPQDVILDDLVEDSQVILSPLNAKYGDSSAGLINVVEKTGTNEFSGSLRLKLSRANWAAMRPNGYNQNGLALNTFQPVPVDPLNKTYELQFSGPIIKDRLTFTYGTRLTPKTAGSATAADAATATGNSWVYYRGAAYKGDPFNSQALRTGPTGSTFHQGRLYWQLNSNHTLDYSHSENFNQFFDYNGSNFPTVDATVDPDQNSVNRFRQLTYRGIIGTSGVLEARYGKRTSNIKFTSGPGDPIYLLYGPSTGTTFSNSAAQWGTNGARSDKQKEQRDTISATLNYQHQLELAGQHSIDVGMNYIETIWGTVQNSGGPNGIVFGAPGKLDPSVQIPGVANAGGKYIVFHHLAKVGANGTAFIPTAPANNPNAPATVRKMPWMIQYTGVPQATLKKPSTSYYLNDQWAINSHWNVMLGLRLEQWKYSDGLGEKYNSSALSPRMEVKYDIHGDNSRVLNFSYGEFRGNVGERITRAQSTFRNTTTITRYWDKFGPDGIDKEYLVDKADIMNPANYGFVYSFDVPNAIFAINKNFKPERNKEMVFGFRRSFSSGGGFRLEFVNRVWDDLPNAMGSLNPISIPDPTNSGLAPKTNYLRTLVNDPQAKRTYNGLELDFKTSVMAGWYLQGSYTYSRLTGNSLYGDNTGFTFTENIALTGVFRPRFAELGIASDAYQPEGQFGTSIGNMFKLLAVYSIQKGNVRSSFSLLGRFIQGSPEDLTQTVLIPSPGLNSAIGTLPGTYQHYYNGRGQYLSPDQTLFDFNYNLEIPIGKKLKTFAQLNIVNVFNTIRPGTLNRGSSGAEMATPVGYRVSSTLNFGAATSNSFFVGARSFNLDLGLRF